MTSTDPAQQASERVWSVEGRVPELLEQRQLSRKILHKDTDSNFQTVGNFFLNTLQLLFSSLQVKIAQLPRNLGVVISSHETDAQICC